MQIITISREFGSGGRELGKRLADILSYDYYDKEIIEKIAENKGMDKDYTAFILENPAWRTVPLHFRRSFSGMTALQAEQKLQTSLLLEQKRVIEAIVEVGRDCVIVGRNADVLLKAYHPLRLFVCAEMSEKIRRCMERAESGENLTHREIERKIRSIDKNRQQTREMISGSRRGECSAYHLIINTTEWEIKELAPAVAEFAKHWFGRGNPCEK